MSLTRLDPVEEVWQLKLIGKVDGPTELAEIIATEEFLGELSYLEVGDAILYDDNQYQLVFFDKSTNVIYVNHFGG